MDCQVVKIESGDIKCCDLTVLFAISPVIPCHFPSWWIQGRERCVGTDRTSVGAADKGVQRPC